MDFEAKNLVVILGPTAVGKSATAIKLAKKLRGEIINCDSMQVYEGFDIGTDKIPENKRENIPHHLIDVIQPSAQFTAADFVHLALEAARTILNNKKLPIIAGGTGLYLKSLIDGLFPGGKSDWVLRQRLEKEAQSKGLESLRVKLKDIDPLYYQKIGKGDKLRIIRALEVYYLTQKSLSEHFAETRTFVEDFNIIKIGLKLERQVLNQRIEERVDKMFKKGIIQEVQSLLEKGVDESSPSFRALGYKYVLRYLKGTISLDESIALIKRDTRHYAKRQMTWFRKMEGIKWFSPYDFRLILREVEIHLK